MKKWFLLLLVLAVAGLALIIGLGRMSRARGQRALEQYKAELRAKGEKLTWEELGFPRAPEANGGFAKFFAAVARLGPGTRIRTAFDARSFVAPGQARVAWASDTVPLAELEVEVSNSSESLAEIRQALENPPARWMSNPTNLPSPPGPDFVALRNAAQWLAGDCLFALRMNQQDRARDDLHAIAQLVQVYREDLGLVSQMFRVAIASFGLTVVWETLQAGGWTDAELAAMQQDWEKLCLTECPELGMVAQRAILEQAVTRLREGNVGTIAEFSGSTPSGPRSAREYFEQFIILPSWRANSVNDELLCLRQCQKALDLMRELNAGKPWPKVKAGFRPLKEELELKARGPGRSFHFLPLVLPHWEKETETATRCETERRMAVVAIALKRYELRHGKSPLDLAALVPEFLNAVPIDPMSGKPLACRLNTDGTFVLYSVGEDGKDDGGDPRPAARQKPDLWNGRDAVWPTPVFGTNAPPQPKADMPK